MNGAGTKECSKPGLRQTWSSTTTVWLMRPKRDSNTKTYVFNHDVCKPIVQNTGYGLPVSSVQGTLQKLPSALPTSAITDSSGCSGPEIHRRIGLASRCGVRWCHSKTLNYGPHFWSIFYQFEEGQRHQLCMDLFAVFADCYNDGQLWTGCALQRTKRFAVPSVGSATRFANFWLKFSKTKKNRPHSCAKYFIQLLFTLLLTLLTYSSICA